MIRLQELSSYLNDYLNVALFTDYCPNGMQVEGKNGIRKLGFAVSASLETLEKCAQEGCDALIVHHGLFWKGDGFPLVGSKRHKLQVLFEKEISLLAYHLPLDAHVTVGNNWVAAREMGWKELEPFDVGVKGKCVPQTPEAFAHSLERYFSHPATVCLGGKKEIETVAFISGGAYKSLATAAACGCDAFVTGNFDEPAWWMAKEEGIHFFALGHYATEKSGLRALKEHLEKKWPIEMVFLDLPNPF